MHRQVAVRVLKEEWILLGCRRQALQLTIYRPQQQVLIKLQIGSNRWIEMLMYFWRKLQLVS
uniref:Uncharacterized protein n=1 Tax=Curvibacter symbiont subsp. Hydra magnipapillata TaxID=667019 RepID=C9Y8W4_CURXX|nr:hypothetical protein Csp_A05650 [Curvibacter putative symbiont of Hydra magnipapillata]